MACDVARAALRSTDGKVTMLCLEQRNEMPASAAEVAEAEEEGIEVKNGWGPEELKKDASGNVTAIVFKKCTQVKDADGRFNPQYDESDTLEIPCGNVLMAIGQAAVWGDLLKNTKCELRRGGTIVADPVTLQTAEPDIFAGGDIEHGARFAIDAIGNARIVTQSINRFVHPGQSMTIGRDLREFIELDRDDIDPNAEGYDNCPRQAIGHREGNPRKSYEDLRIALTEEQVHKEANRCLKCGATVVDLNKCIGCGLCTTRCEFDAIHLTRDLPHSSDLVAAEGMMKAIGKYMPQRTKAIIKYKTTGKHAYPTKQTADGIIE